MQLTWYGHSAFRVEAGGAKILIDPFFTGNPAWEGGWEKSAEGITHVLLTHGHSDHIGDSVAILKTRDAGCQFRDLHVSRRAGRQRRQDQSGQHRRHRRLRRFHHDFVQALHSSSFNGENGANTYLGNPLGLVLHFSGDKTLYHMGDTDIFGDMALINELHQPDIGIVPIGDRFTMGGAVAALACRRFFAFKTVVPCHYGWFGIIDQNADKFVTGMEGAGTNVIVPEKGKAFEA